MAATGGGPVETGPGSGPEQPPFDPAVYGTKPSVAALDSTLHSAVCETLFSNNSPGQTVDFKPLHAAPVGA